MRLLRHAPSKRLIIPLAWRAALPDLLDLGRPAEAEAARSQNFEDEPEKPQELGESAASATLMRQGDA